MRSHNFCAGIPIRIFKSAMLIYHTQHRSIYIRKASDDLIAMPGYDPKTFDADSEDNQILFGNLVLKYVQNDKDLPKQYRGVMDLRKWDEADREKFLDTVQECFNKLDEQYANENA